MSRETGGGDDRGETVADDEQLEIVFWWMGGDDSQSCIEDELDEHLSGQVPARRRRRRPWPGRRVARSAEPLRHPA